MIDRIWHAIGGDTARFLPAAASSFATTDDKIMMYMLAVSAVFVVGIFTTLAWFTVKYRYRPGNEVARRVETSYAIEITWTLVPFALVLVGFFWGAHSYLDEMTPRKNAENIFVVGKQWMWKIEHENGATEIDHIHVPTGRDVNLVMISEDVIHSFFIPDFRVKYDVLPGRYTRTWFRAERPGSYGLLCTQYCGTDHAEMIGTIEAMEPQDYELWLKRQSSPPALTETSIERGHRLFTKNGCVSCHDTGSGTGPKIGPELAGRFIKGDEERIRTSILRPSTTVASGYSDVMPTYSGAIHETELIDLINYLTSLDMKP